jgi:hypothetical protein
MSDRYSQGRNPLDKRDWRRGVSKPHQIVNCPSCAGATHKRGVHLQPEQVKERLWRQRQRAAASQAASS